MAYFIVEARWDRGERPPFEELRTSPVIGELPDAKQAAAEFLWKHFPFCGSLQWLQGVSDKNGPVYYANHPKITFRIRK
jgi:hypothetical protein